MNITYAETVSTLALLISFWAMYLNRDKLHFDKGRAAQADLSSRLQRVEDDFRLRLGATRGASEIGDIIVWALGKGLPMARTYEVAITLLSPHYESVNRAKGRVHEVFDKRVDNWRKVVRAEDT